MSKRSACFDFFPETAKPQVETGLCPACASVAPPGGRLGKLPPHSFHGPAAGVLAFFGLWGGRAGPVDQELPLYLLPEEDRVMDSAGFLPPTSGLTQRALDLGVPKPLDLFFPDLSGGGRGSQGRVSRKTGESRPSLHKALKVRIRSGRFPRVF